MWAGLHGSRTSVRIHDYRLFVPSIRHEIPLQLLRNRPEVAPQIARTVLGLAVPDLPCWRPGPETVTLLSPGELHLDIVLVGTKAVDPEYAIRA